jgi:predicted amidohydrolase
LRPGSSNKDNSKAAAQLGSMIVALASPCIASSLDEGLDKIKRFLSKASAQGAEIVCFPEAYLPDLRGQDFDVLPFDQRQQERVPSTLRKRPVC